MERIDYERLCMGCMSGGGEPGHPCPACGFEEGGYAPAPQVLPLRTILNGKYLLGRAIGQGGFGILYLGWDLNLDLKLAIKEYFPDGFVTRDGHTTTLVSAYAGNSEAFFRSGREKFIDEAKRLARFHALPGIVSVRDYFEENGTAYIVMEFIEGETLKDYLEGQGGRLSSAWVLEKLRPLLESLAVMHQHGIIHRDISPDNIMIDELGQFRLLDFGAAREYEREGSQTILLKPGYAPYEQYQTHGEQGPWTDVYALCATIYRCITGETPVEASMRLPKDPLQPPRALGADMPPAQQAVLMKGLAIDFHERWQDVASFWQALDAAKGGEEKDSLEKKKKTDQEDIGKNKDDRGGLQRFFSAQKNGLMGKFTWRQWSATLGICIVALAAVVWLAPKAGLSPKDDGKAALPAAVSSAGFLTDEKPGDNVPEASSSASATSSSVVPPVSEWDTLPSGEDATPMRQPENPDAEIVFQDAAMEFHIRNALNKPENPITAGELAGVRQLHIIDTECCINEEQPKSAYGGGTQKMPDGSPVPHLSSLSDLAYFINLREFSLRTQEIKNISTMPHMEGLQVLDLGNNKIDDISVLSSMRSLKKLNLRANSIEDFSPLSSLTELEDLDVSTQYGAHPKGSPADISFLESLDRLQNLKLTALSLEQCPSLSHMTGLHALEMSGNYLTDISPLSELSRLVELSIYDNDIEDISPLAGLTELTRLNVDGNKITDLSPLVSLLQLADLDLSGNGNLEQLAALSGLKKLEKLNINSTEVVDISPLAELTSLRELELNGRPMMDKKKGIRTDLSPLSGLIQLEKLRMWGVDPVSTKPLTSLKGLRVLDASFSLIDDLSSIGMLTSLEELDLSSTPAVNLAPLGQLRNLRVLSLEGTNRESYRRQGELDLSPLAGLPYLTELNLSGNGLQELQGLQNLPALNKLDVSENSLKSLDGLSSLAGLIELEANVNEITDISGIAGNTHMQTLILSANRISDLSPVAGMKELQELKAASNAIRSIEALAGLPMLHTLYLGNQEGEITDWSPVAHIANVDGRPK